MARAGQIVSLCRNSKNCQLNLERIVRIEYKSISAMGIKGLLSLFEKALKKINHELVFFSYFVSITFYTRIPNG